MPELANCPVEDCKLTVDIVLKSSDGELFGAHQRNLEIYTEGFPIAGSTVVSDGSDPVSLEETAEVLRMMLRYTHHTRLPNLDTISFTFLVSLAEAVEKYMIYSGMEVCRMKMTHATDDHPNEVFFYSVKHNYLDLADKAAKLTLKNPASNFLLLIREAGLHDDVAFRWLRYQNYWVEALLYLPTLDEPCHYNDLRLPCSISHDSRLDTELRQNLGASPSHVFNIANCKTCRSDDNTCASQVREKIEKLPKYSEVG